jgi:hypothetical protein
MSVLRLPPHERIELAQDTRSYYYLDREKLGGLSPLEFERLISGMDSSAKRALRAATASGPAIWPSLAVHTITDMTHRLYGERGAVVAGRAASSGESLLPPYGGVLMFEAHLKAEHGALDQHYDGVVAQLAEHLVHRHAEGREGTAPEEAIRRYGAVKDWKVTGR